MFVDNENLNKMNGFVTSPARYEKASLYLRVQMGVYFAKNQVCVIRT